MIIDKSYFTGNKELPNIEQGTVNPDLVLNNDKLIETIKRYEFKYLCDVFGVTIAKEILDQVNTDGTFVPGVQQKYVDLIDGSGDWLGLRYEINGVKYSQIADFCYCQYLFENETQLSNLGNSTNDIEKGKLRSSWNKVYPVWREMMKHRQRADHYLEFPLYLDYLQLTTLWDYISNNDDWNTKHFVYYQNANSLGI